MVEWSEQLRSVTSVWLGAAAAAFKSDSAPAGVARKIFDVVYSDSLLPVVYIQILDLQTVKEGQTISNEV